MNRVAVLAFALVLAGVSKSSQSLAANDEGRDLAYCKLSVYGVEKDGTINPKRVLGPEHVKSIQAVDEPPSLGAVDVEWIVKLTREGGKLNRAYSASNIGNQIALFCNGHEVSRPYIADESGDEFVIF